MRRKSLFASALIAIGLLILGIVDIAIAQSVPAECLNYARAYTFGFEVSVTTPEELAQAITCANADALPARIRLAGDIVFTAPDPSSTENALPTITSEIMIFSSYSTLATLERDMNASCFRIFHNTGNLTLEYMIIENGCSSSTGGAIHNDGILNLRHMVLATNSALEGGGIYNTGTLNTYPRTNFYENQATSGALIYNANAATINLLGTDGMYNFGGSGVHNLGTAYLEKSTIAYSTGGVALWNANTMTLINATLLQNGIGIQQTGGTLTTTNITSHQETAVDISGGTATIQNSLFLGDGSTVCNLSITLTGTNNMADDSTCGGTFQVTSNVTLAPLDYYPSADSRTLLAEIGSDNIDAGNTTVVNNLGLTEDQRGENRVIDGVVDIGATEYSSTPVEPEVTPESTPPVQPPPDTATCTPYNTYYDVGQAYPVTTPSDFVTAIECGNIHAQPISISVQNDMTFSAAVALIHDVNFVLPAILNDTTILGNNYMLELDVSLPCNWGSIYYFFYVWDELSLHDITLSNGCGAIENRNTLSIYNSTITNTQLVVAIRERGQSLWVENSTFSDNASAAIYQYWYDRSELTIKNSHFENNYGSLSISTANALIEDSSFILNYGAQAVDSYTSSLIIRDTLFDGNTSSACGTALFVGESAVLERVTLINNTTSQYGGAICVFGTLVVRDSLINNNRADWGGGISIMPNYYENPPYTSEVIIERSTLSNNTATVRGGAIYLRDANILDIRDSLIQGNTAPTGSGIYSESTATTLITNDTFTENTGGYALHAVSDSLALINTTIVGQSAALHLNGSAATAHNNLIAGTCNITAGTVSSNNLATDNSCSNIATIVPDLGIGTLSDNGGSTLTIPIEPFSAAIDSGDNVVTEQYFMGTDQRGAGYPRIRNSTVDIGAYESFFDADVNNDNLITPVDAIFVINRIGLTPTGGDAPADVDGDGDIDNDDAQAVLLYLGMTP